MLPEGHAAGRIPRRRLEGPQSSPSTPPLNQPGRSPMPKTIAFHSSQISVRGTEVALYDYALHNERLLNNRSLVVYDSNSPENHAATLRKFEDRFEVVGYASVDELDGILRSRKADLLYAIKSGEKDGLVSKLVPTMVHAVFPVGPWEVHGSSFAFISEWLSRHCSRDRVPCVPHIVDLPEISDDLREGLAIPRTALVLGCHGGAQSFDVRCAIEAVGKAVERAPDLYFLFLNIAPFTEHPRIIFLPGTADLAEKTRFINSCDAMLHARQLGESFGLACGEFSIRNKPVITFRRSRHTHHHDVLGPKGFYYHDTESLLRIIGGMRQSLREGSAWDCYSFRYNPEKVMELFEKHLIRPALARGLAQPAPEPSAMSRLSYKWFNFRMKNRLL